MEKSENFSEKNLITFNNASKNRNNSKNCHSQSSKNPSRKSSIYNNSSKNLNILPNNFSSNNRNKSFLLNMQFIDEENNKLKELLSDLNNEIKEKEEALNESKKIISKLKDEYSKVMKENKKIELENNKLLENKEKSQKMFDNMKKTQAEFEKISKQNEQLKEELIKTRENINYYKSNYSNINNDLNKLEKDKVTKELIIKDLKIEGDKCVNMLQDREVLIENYSKKINELKKIINQKNEQLKLMVNFSKEINNENKSNVKEIAKQAVKTIKVFYNTINNKDNNKNQVNFIEIKNSKLLGPCNCNNITQFDNRANNTNQNDINLMNNLFDNKLNSQNCSMHLIDCLKDLLYIPEEGTNFINKEFLIDKNFKTGLLKTELFSSLIREYNLYNFFKGVFGKLDISIAFHTGIYDKLRKLNDFKFQFDQMKTAFNIYLKDNIVLKNKLNDLILYVDKLKNDFDKKSKKYKEKINELLDLINTYEDYLDNKNDNKKDIPNNVKILKEEINNLNLQLDKTNNDNHNLNDKIKENEKIIDKLKNEIDLLNTKLNSLRTSPPPSNPINYIEIKEISFQIDKIEENNNLNNNENEIQNIEDNLNNKKLNDFSSSLPENKRDFNKSEHSSSNQKLEIQPSERFTYFLNTIKKTSKINMDILDNITPIKISSNILNNNLNDNLTNNNFIEENSLSKLTNFKNNLEVQQQSDITENQEILLKTKYFLEDFKRELNENNFMEIAQRNIGISKIFSFLTSKIEQIKNVIFSVKEKLKRIHKDKKISHHNFIQILNYLENFLSYVFIHLNLTNGEFLSILPTITIIYNLISKFIYNKSFNKFLYTNNKYDNEINTLKLKCPIEDINIETSVNTSSRDNSFKKFQELKQIFDINKKIFSTSELIKYRNIYKNLSMSQMIKVFKETCNNLKKTTHNLKINYRNNKSVSEYSEYNETLSSRLRTSQKSFNADSEDYRIVNEKIFKLKKFEFDFKILMELLKHYFICFEIIFNKIEKEYPLKNKTNLIELVEEMNIIFNLFEDMIYYKMDELDDDTIFNRKIILKLIQNHKDYLSIIYNLKY